MKGYFVRSTKVTPSIYFNPKNSLLDIRGKSSPENPLAFYNYIYHTLDQYESDSYSEITINLAFEHFNTSSSKCLYMMLKKIEKLFYSGKKVVVNWYYETDDEDMFEAGEDFSSLFNFNFFLLEIPEIKALGSPKTEQKRKVAA